MSEVEEVPAAWPAWRRHGLAVAAVLVAHAARVGLDSWIRPPFVFSYPVVILCALLLGRGPGLVATGLATTLSLVFVLPRLNPGQSVGPAEVLAAAAFAAIGVVTSLYAGRFQRLRSRVDALEAANAARASEARYALLAENTDELVWKMDLATRRFTFVSPAVPRLRGLTVEEALAQAPSEALTPASWDAAAAWFATIGTSGEPAVHLGVYEHTCKDGSTKPLEVRAHVLRGPDGAPVEVLGVSRDVSDRVLAERRLAQSERDFRTLFDHAGVGIAETDPADGRFVRVNDRFCELLGYPREELLALRVRDVTHPDDLGGSLEAMRRMVELREPYRTAKRYVGKDGSTRRVRLTAAPLWGEGEPPGHVVAVVEDETALHELGEQLRQAQKLESVGRLAGGVAHDFNNLLTVILGCANAALHDLDGGHGVAREDLDEIRLAGLRARDLTRQLLTFARKGVVDPVALDLSRVVRDAEKLLRRTIGEDVVLVTELEPAPWTVVADLGRLEQVLVNLAINGRDAMERGGRLTISVRNLGPVEAAGRSPLLAGNAWVVLGVRDTGGGMSEEVKAHLFEPFFTTKPVGKGTGLGLASVHGIVAQAGGHVFVESEAGRGTFIEVVLPRAAVEPARVDVPARTVALGGTETVLVVEDDPAVRAVTTRTLERAGYRVVQARDGAEALEVARARPEVRAVVTDVVMPGPPLAEVVAELGRTLPGARVIYVSGYPDDVLGERGIATARDELLSKPFPPDALLARLRRVLDAPPDGGAEPAGAATAR